MQLRFIFITLLLSFYMQNMNAQTNTFPSSGAVGIGTTTPHSSSLLEVKSSTRGVLLPRMTKVQRDAIPVATSTTGLLIFQTDNTPGFYYHSGTSWKALTPLTSAANTALSNLSVTTAVNTHLLPKTTKAYDLGNATLAWRNLHLRDDIYLDGTRFVSNAPGTASLNAFVGSNAGLAITSGINNTAVGHDALRKDSTGPNNTAVGTQALYNLGYAGNNTAIGINSMYSSTTGSDNTAVGYYSLYYNKNGEFNTASGALALVNNIGGYANSAYGYAALYNNVSGGYNTGLGAYAADNTHNYTNATFLGASTKANDNLTNITAIGFNARALSSNQVMLGNTSVTSVVAAGGYYLYSDGRFKTDVQEGVPGLSFINKLRPVTYHYNVHELNNHLHAESPERKKNQSLSINRQQDAALRQQEEQGIRFKEQMLYTGFVAQEVEKAAGELKYDFSGIHKPTDDKDVYALSYSDFVVPLVKAVQELDAKTKEIDELKVRIQKLEALLTKSNSIPINVSGAYLEQSSPNPSRSTTTIRYMIPDGVASARLILTNVKGQVLKETTLASRGTGQLNLNTAALPSGTYTYSLWVEGIKAASRQLVIAR